eukprot:Pgem_evm1s4172
MKFAGPAPHKHHETFYTAVFAECPQCKQPGSPYFFHYLRMHAYNYGGWLSYIRKQSKKLKALSTVPVIMTEFGGNLGTNDKQNWVKTLKETYTADLPDLEAAYFFNKYKFNTNDQEIGALYKDLCKGNLWGGEGGGSYTPTQIPEQHRTSEQPGHEQQPSHGHESEGSGCTGIGQDMYQTGSKVKCCAGGVEHGGWSRGAYRYTCKQGNSPSPSSPSSPSAVIGETCAPEGGDAYYPTSRRGRCCSGKPPVHNGRQMVCKSGAGAISSGGSCIKHHQGCGGGGSCCSGLWCKRKYDGWHYCSSSPRVGR